MTVHAETRVIPHRPDELYALVADVRRYPEFLPWCMAARIRELAAQFPTPSAETLAATAAASIAQNAADAYSS